MFETMGMLYIKPFWAAQWFLKPRVGGQSSGHVFPDPGGGDKVALQSQWLCYLRNFRFTMGFLTGGFKYFFIFTSTWGNDPIWLIFFRWVETTNQFFQAFIYQPKQPVKIWNEMNPKLLGAVKTQLNSKIKTQQKVGKKTPSLSTRAMLGWKLRRRNIDPGSRDRVVFFGNLT